MPLYEYECFVCGYRFERLQRLSAEPVSECPACGGSVRRLLGVPALQFKGSGFYITDYGKGGGKADREETPPTTSADAPKSNAKPDASAASDGKGDPPA